jgi:thioredoxin 2
MHVIEARDGPLSVQARQTRGLLRLHPARRGALEAPMSDTIGDRPRVEAAEMLVVACPSDASLNRVPRAKLDKNPKCGRCHNPLFQGKAVGLNAANFDSQALKSDLPIVIDFWAEWCGPCRMMTPNFEMAVPRLEPRVRLGKLDTEAEPAIARRYGIRGIPSMVMIKKGREVARTSGAMPTSAIVAWVEQALHKA